MRITTIILQSLVLVCLGLLNVGCDGSDDSTGGTLETPSTDASGTWAVTDTVHAEDCGEGTYVESGYLTVEQDGNNLIVRDTSGNAFHGTISGNTVVWSGSYPEDGGTTTDSINATISGNSLSGTSRWSWTDGVDSCSGTSEFRAAKV